jgi:Sulfotransferase family
VHVSDRWRFVYIRQPKSSSTAVLHAIKQQLCGLPDGKGECQPDELRHVTSLDNQIWQDYFVFTFVRNPWTRMLSAYKMFMQHFLRR